MTSFFEIDNLNFFYGEIRVLWNTSLKIDIHEIVHLVGSKVAGKLTLLNAISGLIRSYLGLILMEGKRIEGNNPQQTVG